MLDSTERVGGCTPHRVQVSIPKSRHRAYLRIADVDSPPTYPVSAITVSSSRQILVRLASARDLGRAIDRFGGSVCALLGATFQVHILDRADALFQTIEATQSSCDRWRSLLLCLLGTRQSLLRDTAYLVE